MSGAVTDNAGRRRYELDEEGETAFVSYSVDGKAIALEHTIVPEALEGRGVGTRLVQGALDDVRERRLRVIPACSFVRHFIDTHDEYRDLVA